MYKRQVYYRCDPSNDFLPDPAEIETLVSSRTRAIVLINPNNPTGANYPRELLERIVAIAAKHRLLLMADEIYDGILYDDNTFQPIAPLAGDLPCMSFGGLSKVHRACGWRVGWAVLSGDPLALSLIHILSKADEGGCAHGHPHPNPLPPAGERAQPQCRPYRCV